MIFFIVLAFLLVCFGVISGSPEVIGFGVVMAVVGFILYLFKGRDETPDWEKDTTTDWRNVFRNTFFAIIILLLILMLFGQPEDPLLPEQRKQRTGESNDRLKKAVDDLKEIRKD
ncbi:MAG: hypothetical protein L0Y56_16570 [Nitrospira sp.]|nr:hypothetical protein [Nitrospira sp.]